MRFSGKIYITVTSALLSLVIVVCTSHCAFSQDAQLNPAYELKPFSMQLIGNLVPDEDQLRAGLLYDVKRNTIVWQKDMDYAWPIASLTKMMVGLLAVEDVEAGRVSMNDTIYVQNTYKKKIRRRKYKTYTVTERYMFSDLLKMAMIRSHNESTVWIAKRCSETVETFVSRMNQKAIELGMTRTFYNNTSGLPAPGAMVDNSSSPRDLLLLSLECIKHQQLMDITAIPYVTVNNGLCNVNYRNHNGLTINYTGQVDGIKTGYTKAAGFCLSATTGRADHRLISIVLGTRSPWVRNGIVAGMINEYYDAIHLGRLGEEIPDLTANNAFLDSLTKGLVAIVPRMEGKHSDTADVSFAYTYKIEIQRIKKSITVKSGDNLGKIASRTNSTVAELKKWNKLKTTRVIKGQRLIAYTTVRKKVPVKLEVIPEEDIAENDSCVDENINEQLKATAKNKKEMVDASKEHVVSQDIVAIKKSSKKGAYAERNNSPKMIFHKVQPGDTLWNIAQRYRTTIQEIKRVNKINKNQIKIGISIKVPVVS